MLLVPVRGVMPMARTNANSTCSGVLLYLQHPQQRQGGDEADLFDKLFTAREERMSGFAVRVQKL